MAKLQDEFLGHLKENKKKINVYLVNGIKLSGVLSKFDQYVIELKHHHMTQLVYKHAISTIAISAEHGHVGEDRKGLQED